MTLRVREDVGRLRGGRTFRAIRSAFAAGCQCDGFRLVHYSIQREHLHLVVEAKGTDALRRGIQGLAIRLARALNRVCDRRGKVFSDRYHARLLRSPLEVRRALAYVLNNAFNHLRVMRPDDLNRGFDRFSSAAEFDGWATRPPPCRDGPPCTLEARTWLLRVGWRKHGRIKLGEIARG